MLLRLQLLERQTLTLFERRQLVLECLVLFVLAFLRFFINFQETFELEHRTGHAEVVGAIRNAVDIDGCLIEHRRQHLRGDEALPDELVNLVLIFLEILLYRIRMASDGAWTNRFVGFLRFFLRFVDIG